MRRLLCVMILMFVSNLQLSIAKILCQTQNKNDACAVCTFRQRAEHEEPDAGAPCTAAEDSHAVRVAMETRDVLPYPRQRRDLVP